MPANYTRTINWTGQNTGSGANYSWEDVNGAEAQGWITRSNTSGDVWNFNISDNTASNAVTRTATYRVKHWTYTDGQDLNTWDEFTITQYASGTVVVTTQATAATTQATGATAATTLATLATAATTQPTGATAATTLATNATAATTLATNATAATTLATNATAATTLATNATAATTLATLEPKTITWNGNTATPFDAGQSLLKFPSIDPTSASGQTLLYAPGSSGAGAGRLYWSSDATGASQVAEPSWAQVDSITSFGSGSGVGNPQTARVVITIDSYPAVTTTTSSGSGSGTGSGGNNLK
jgi:hypothetical protein